MNATTPERILQAARRLFVQQGYTATSMRQVAEAAGIGKATIYHHFPDKEAILMTLLDDIHAAMLSTLAATRAETDPRGRFQVGAEASIRFLYTSADILQIARRELPDSREQFKVEFAAFVTEYRALLADALQRGIAAGLFRPVDPAQTARVFMTMIQGNFTMVYVAGERPQPPEQAAAALLDVFFNGINLNGAGQP